MVSPFTLINRVVVLDDFSILCAVRADLSPLITCAVATMGPAGEEFWAIAFSIEIQFGLTEFKASIKWIDNVRFSFIRWV